MGRVLGISKKKDLLKVVNDDLILKNEKLVLASLMSTTMAFARIVLKYKIPKILYTDIKWTKIVKSLPKGAFDKELGKFRKNERNVYFLL